MNIELILWSAAGLIISEIIYIFWMKWIKKHERNKFLFFHSDEWFLVKFSSLGFAAFFMAIQGLIIFPSLEPIPWGNGNYINLLWEFLIIAGVIIFFYINKLISKRIKGGKNTE